MDRVPTDVTWFFAPEWVTPEKAAQLMGRHYSVQDILELVQEGAVDTKAGEELLIEKESLMEYRDALALVLMEEAAEAR